MTEKLITIQDLQRYDGEYKPAYIAYLGIVYDVSESMFWEKGIHEGQHFPGQDLSLELKDAPHGIEVFNRPSVKKVGLLASSKDELKPSEFK